MLYYESFFQLKKQFANQNALLGSSEQHFPNCYRLRFSSNQNEMCVLDEILESHVVRSRVDMNVYLSTTILSKDVYMCSLFSIIASPNLFQPMVYFGASTNSGEIFGILKKSLPFVSSTHPSPRIQPCLLEIASHEKLRAVCTMARHGRPDLGGSTR